MTNYYILRILFHTVDAKFDTIYTNKSDAERAKSCIQQRLIQPDGTMIGDVLLLPTTQVRGHRNGFTMVETRRGYVIRCTNQKNAGVHIPILYFQTDKSGPSATWDASSNGWIVRKRDREAAEQFIFAQNKSELNLGGGMSILEASTLLQC